MFSMLVVGAVLTFGLVLYLGYALLFPERLV
jgi:K+-transporting ATPase KdpF subunit